MYGHLKWVLKPRGLLPENLLPVHRNLKDLKEKDRKRKRKRSKVFCGVLSEWESSQFETVHKAHKAAWLCAEHESGRQTIEQIKAGRKNRKRSCATLGIKDTKLTNYITAPESGG